jgi:hypothetical protein
MKKYILVVAVVIMVVVMAGSVWATPATQTVTTTATVQGLCKNGTNGTLTFPGPIDPSSGANVTASTAGLTYSCSNGATFMITGIAGGTGGIGGVSGGDCTGFTGTMKDGGGTGVNTLQYTLACATAPFAGPYTGQGFGPGKAVSVVLSGTITPTEFQNAFAAAYTDIVTVTVSY